MTPVILLALLGFGLTAFMTTSSSEDDIEDTSAEVSDDEFGPIPDVSIIPEMPQEPEAPDTEGALGFFNGSEEAQSVSTTINSQLRAEDGNFVDVTGDDLVFGTTGAETIGVGDGNDTVVSREGNDIVFGDAGDDLIFLGDGDDQAAGFDFNDEGDDTIVGGAGDDYLADSVGNNQVFGGDGNDELSTSDGFESGLSAPITSSSPDFVDGGAGNDFITADDGDTIIGGTGADIITIDRNQDLPFDQSPAIIEDFNPDEDFLIVDLDRAGSSTELPPITFREDITSEGLMVFVEDTPLVFLRGLGDADIANISVTHN